MPRSAGASTTKAIGSKTEIDGNARRHRLSAQKSSVLRGVQLVMRTKGETKLFQLPMKVMMPSVASAGPS